MSNRPHGVNVYIDQDYPSALGICDVTGFVFPRHEMVRQMEWRGNALVWTGLYVGRPYASSPNECNRPPISFPDPIAVRDPRVQQSSYSVPLFQAALPENQRFAQLQQINFLAPGQPDDFTGSPDGTVIPIDEPEERFEDLQQINFIT